LIQLAAASVAGVEKNMIDSIYMIAKKDVDVPVPRDPRVPNAP